MREAKLSPWWADYRKAAEDEIAGLEKRGTWELVPIADVPKGKNILRGKFVFDDKRDTLGKLVRFKARFVAMGFTQKEGMDFFETYAGVVNTKTFRTLLSILNSNSEYSMEHWDVKLAFTVAPVEEELYMHQPEGFVKEGQENFVCRLRKSLYGLKQSARNWKNFLTAKMLCARFTPALFDSAIFLSEFFSDKNIEMPIKNSSRRDDTQSRGDAWCIVATHVDDIFPLYNHAGKALRDKLFALLSSSFETSNLGEISWALKTSIERDRLGGVLKISQTQFVREFLEAKGLLDAKGVETPAVDYGGDASMSEEDLPQTASEKAEVSKLTFREDIGSLFWIASISRPDIYFAVHRASKWQNKPSLKLWRWLDRIKKYLLHTMDLGIIYTRGRTQVFSAYCDAAFATESCALSRIGWLFLHRGNLVSWGSENPKRVMTSSTEVECSALTYLCKEVMWQRVVHAEMKSEMECVEIFEDNQACISMCSGAHTTHKRSKHFDIEFNFCRQSVELKEVSLTYCPTDLQNADLLTKPLGERKFIFFRDRILGSRDLQDHVFPLLHIVTNMVFVNDSMNHFALPESGLGPSGVSPGLSPLNIPMYTGFVSSSSLCGLANSVHMPGASSSSSCSALGAGLPCSSSSSASVFGPRSPASSHEFASENKREADNDPFGCFDRVSDDSDESSIIDPDSDYWKTRLDDVPPIDETPEGKYTNALCNFWAGMIEMSELVRRVQDPDALAAFDKVVHNAANIITRDPGSAERVEATKDMLNYLESIRNHLPKAVLKASGFYLYAAPLMLSGMVEKAQRYLKKNCKGGPSEYQWRVFDHISSINHDSVVVARAPSKANPVIHSLLCSKFNPSYQIVGFDPCLL
jgi:hypothetical protein